LAGEHSRSHLTREDRRELKWLKRLVEAAKRPRGEKRNLCLKTVTQTALDASVINERFANVACVVEVQPGTTIYANEDAVREIFVNVIVNAAEAMPDGGGLLRITASPCVAAPSSGNDESTEGKNDANYVRVSFDDDGNGISQADFENIGKQAFSTKKDHDGLGIAISKAAVRAQGGGFTLSRKADKGMLVEVILVAQSKEE
jgi:signal transduction histidine kinase